MHLIALKDFRNVRLLRLQTKDDSGKASSDIKDAQHVDHIHRGARFEIGSGKTLKDCEQEEKEIIAQLIVSGCAGDANDKDIVKGVEEQIALDRKREANASKLSRDAALSHLGAQAEALIKGGSK